MWAQLESQVKSKWRWFCSVVSLGGGVMGGGRAKQANDNNIIAKGVACALISSYEDWGLTAERDIATTMQSPDNNIVCRSSRMDNNKTSTSEDTSSTCSSNKAPPPPMPTRLLASSVSSSSSLSASSAAAATAASVATQQYANVAEIMSTSKKYDSNQVCFKNLNFSRVTIWIHGIGTNSPTRQHLSSNPVHKYLCLTHIQWWILCPLSIFSGGI